jgi:cyclopropane-fatty-acyl-phospholipid synthase
MTFGVAAQRSHDGKPGRWEHWLRNFEANWDRIRAIDPHRFSEKFRRTWLFFLGGAAETFEAAREIINCYHITFVKGHFTYRAW